MIPQLRLRGHQLADSRFDDPKQLVSWMGAVQGQDLRMCKWALGVRLRSGTLRRVQEALDRGEVLRTHLLRPTWHLVAAEDIRWMLGLSGDRIKTAGESYARSGGISVPDGFYAKGSRILGEMLEGRSLTKTEIAEEFARQRFPVSDLRLTDLLIVAAEADALVCSGPEKSGKHTYALLEERVPPVAKLHREEALAVLARRYFQSHAPATLADFAWWSGLPLTDARHAAGLIGGELVEERFGSEPFFVHQSCKEALSGADVHLLPPYDEYLIGYKDRSAVLHPDHYARAFNSWGIFYPVVLRGGTVVGNWKKSKTKAGPPVDASFFKARHGAGVRALRAAVDRYSAFLG